MSDDKTGGYAFPMLHECVHVGETGMTLRDYFAGQALTGLCANAETVDNFDTPSDIAKVALGIADAMIKARGDV